MLGINFITVSTPTIFWDYLTFCSTAYFCTLFHELFKYIKPLFIIPTDAHNYKITGMLKQLKFW